MKEPTEDQKAKAREVADNWANCNFKNLRDECRSLDETIAQALADEAERAVHAEREACAMVCIKHASRWDGGDPGGCEHEVLRGAADAIRSRGTP